MALKIRLRQQGRRNRPFFRLVVADERSPRDGRYVESLGWYNPIEKDESKVLSFNEERIQHWLGLGAQLTENAASLVKRSVPSIKQWLMERELTRRTRTATKRKERKKELAKK